MNVIRELTEYSERMKDALKKVNQIRSERSDFVSKNKKQLKELYPKKGKTYMVLSPLSIRGFSSSFDKKGGLHHYLFGKICPKEKGEIFFKSTSPYREVVKSFNEGVDYPMVRGVLLLKKNEVIAENTLVGVNNLIEIKEAPIVKENKANPNYVYVMIDKNTGFHKIGRSTNPLRRERTLQSEKPTIELIFKIKSEIKYEKFLHAKFKKNRIRGEWFDLLGSDLLWIKEYLNSKKQ